MMAVLLCRSSATRLFAVTPGGSFAEARAKNRQRPCERLTLIATLIQDLSRRPQFCRPRRHALVFLSHLKKALASLGSDVVSPLKRFLHTVLPVLRVQKEIVVG